MTASTFSLSRVARWEGLLVVVLVGLVWLGTRLSGVFLSAQNFSNLTVAEMEIAIIAVPMTLIIIAGEIDLSVESMVGLSSAVLGFLWAAGVPLWIGIPVVLGMGALGGLMNGVLVMRAGLPSLVVTLGTLALFRGLASVVLGPRAISNFPAEFSAFGFGNVPGTPIPWPLVVFALLAIVAGVALHRTWFGRQVFAVGKNQSAARYSGVPVARLKTGLFVVSGLVSALAGVILTSRLSSARSDAGTGMTLAVVTAVLLGGVNIFGGSGTIPGVVLAVFTLAVLQNALRLADVSTELQSISVGLLLIVSVVIPNLARQLAHFLRAARAERHPTRGAPERVPPYTPA
ncbi:MAG: ABC transporter permease [Chloroflexota bacterium]|nr:ABC transporter permease [Chloroflexota bacterium]